MPASHRRLTLRVQLAMWALLGASAIVVALLVGVGIAAALAAWLLMWRLTTRLLAPMNKLRQALRLDANGADALRHDIDADSADTAALLAAYHAQKQRGLALETELAASERRLRDVTNSVPALIAYVDNDQNYCFANGHYDRLLGIDHRKMPGCSVQATLGRKAHAILKDDIEAALRGETRHFEHEHPGLDGPQHLLSTFLPDIAPDGKVAGFHAMTLDITERKQIELALAMSERRLKSITDNLPAMIAYVDCQQVYRFANAHFQHVMGVQPSSLIGRTMHDFLGPAAHAELAEHIAAALGGVRCKFERTGWQHNADVHFLVEYIPDVADASGAVQGFFVLVLDISERKRAELALVHSEQRLRAVTDNLPAMISHFDRDLRYTFANARVGQAFDCDPLSVVGRSLRDVRGETLFAAVAPHMARALAGENVSFEAASNVNGKLQHFEANYVPEVDSAGVVHGIYALTFEVTQRKQAEQHLLASQRLLDRTGTIAGVGGWELDLASNALSWTLQTRRLHEVSEDFVPDVETAIAFYPGEGRAAITQAVAQARAHGTAWDLVLPFESARGRAMWIRVTGEVELHQGVPVRMFGAFQDVSQRLAHERQLREQAELLQVTLKSIGDGVITTDEGGDIRWMNPAAERMTGWASEDARGMPSSRVFLVIHADTRAPAPDPVQHCLRTRTIAGLPSRSVLVSRSGAELAVEDSVSPIHDDAGCLRGAVLVFHDVSEQRRMIDAMAHRATHDELTGLVNRAEFETRLARVLTSARAGDAVSALMFIDLDHFKLVNDACGHAMGDKLLCQVSALMNRCVRNRDTLARLGGDEFGVILERCTVAQAQRVAQSICDEMEAFRFIHDGRKFRVGTSIGLVPVDGRWPGPAALQQAADTACYAAKEAGRNRVHVWFDSDEAMKTRAGETQWVSRIESALDDGRFELHAQRIQALSAPEDGLHCEVLLRLVEADGSRVAPGAFLPAAERFHLASRIDRWVLREVFTWLARHGGDAAVGSVAVNLSGQSIGDRAFHRYAVQLMSDIPFDAAKLCFEVTETAAITNLADATVFVQAMRALGARVALDDFGAGASSFGYLKNLPVDYLKIDGQFIRNVESDPLDMAAVRCFHEVAQAIGVKTIAEFVETDSVIETLRAIGIDYAQGYRIHRPEPLDQLLARSLHEHMAAQPAQPAQPVQPAQMALEVGRVTA